MALNRRTVLLLGTAALGTGAAAWTFKDRFTHGGSSRAASSATAARPGSSHAGSTTRKTATFVDDVGREIALPVPLQRVVVFNRYTSEFIRAIAGIDEIVGFDVDRQKSGAYWPNSDAISIVGHPQGVSAPNYEAIAGVHPDVVFFARNGPWQQASRVLAPFGIPVFVLTAWDVLKHEWNVDLLGRLFGEQARAARLNAFYREHRALLQTRLAGVTRKRVYLEEVGDFKALLKGSGWHDMIETGGGINIFGDVNILDQPKARGTVQGFDTDAEEILARRPEALVKLYVSHHISVDRSQATQILQRLVARPGFADLDAVKRGEVYSVSYYHAGACSKVIGALRLAKWLYPERFEDVDPDESMRVWLEDFQGVPAPGTYWVSLPGRVR